RGPLADARPPVRPWLPLPLPLASCPQLPTPPPLRRPSRPAPRPGAKGTNAPPRRATPPGAPSTPGRRPRAAPPAHDGAAGRPWTPFLPLTRSRRSPYDTIGVTTDASGREDRIPFHPPCEPRVLCVSERGSFSTRYGKIRDGGPGSCRVNGEG